MKICGEYVIKITVTYNCEISCFYKQPRNKSRSVVESHKAVYYFCRPPLMGPPLVSEKSNN